MCGDDKSVISSHLNDNLILLEASSYIDTRRINYSPFLLLGIGGGKKRLKRACVCSMGEGGLSLRPPSAVCVSVYTLEARRVSISSRPISAEAQSP